MTATGCQCGSMWMSIWMSLEMCLGMFQKVRGPAANFEGSRAPSPQPLRVPPGLTYPVPVIATWCTVAAFPSGWGEEGASRYCAVPGRWWCSCSPLRSSYRSEWQSALSSPPSTPGSPWSSSASSRVPPSLSPSLPHARLAVCGLPTLINTKKESACAVVVPGFTTQTHSSCNVIASSGCGTGMLAPCPLRLPIHAQLVCNSCSHKSNGGCN